jgi:hypothetical protein
VGRHRRDGPRENLNHDAGCGKKMTRDKNPKKSCDWIERRHQFFTIMLRRGKDSAFQRWEINP